jgi:acyl-CoA thioester hydrolase
MTGDGRVTGIDDAGWFDSGRAVVRSDWIDYNGHMNVGYYLVAFDQATEAIHVHLGIGEAYRREHDASTFVLEAHVTYDHELLEGAPLAFRTRIVAFDSKRLHLMHRMFHAEEGFLAATNELMCLHVDLKQRKTSPFPDDAMARIREVGEAHARFGATDGAGRSIGIRRR